MFPGGQEAADKLTFVNEFGEVWVYFPANGTDLAMVSGGDVGWKRYPVFRGVPFNLVLDSAELAWLKSASELDYYGEEEDR